MNYQNLSPVEAKKLLDEGAMLVDGRPADEHVREHIVQACHIPIEPANRSFVIWRKACHCYTSHTGFKLS